MRSGARRPFVLVVVDALLGGGLEGVAEEPTARVQGEAFEGVQDLARRGGLGEVVHFGEEVGRLL
jgi:hypothetical protein